VEDKGETEGEMRKEKGCENRENPILNGGTGRK